MHDRYMFYVSDLFSRIRTVFGDRLPARERKKKEKKKKVSVGISRRRSDLYPSNPTRPSLDGLNSFAISGRFLSRKINVGHREDENN